MFTSILKILAIKLIRHTIDYGLRKIIEEEVRKAEKSGKPGQVKMYDVLRAVTSTHHESLINETESTLRTKIEMVIDDIL